MEPWLELAGAVAALAAPAAPAGAPRTIRLNMEQVFSLADAAQERGDIRVAEAAYEALAHDPNKQVRAEALFRHAKLLAKAGQLESAATLFRTLLDERPDAIGARLELARALDLMGTRTLPGANYARLRHQGCHRGSLVSSTDIRMLCAALARWAQASRSRLLPTATSVGQPGRTRSGQFSATSRSMTTAKPSPDSDSRYGASLPPVRPRRGIKHIGSRERVRRPLQEVGIQRHCARRGGRARVPCRPKPRPAGAWRYPAMVRAGPVSPLRTGEGNLDPTGRWSKPVADRSERDAQQQSAERSAGRQALLGRDRIRTRLVRVHGRRAQFVRRPGGCEGPRILHARLASGRDGVARHWPNDIYGRSGFRPASGRRSPRALPR
ncbi:tetratricopeptide repeat protein [Sphingomonas sediminicola]|uniref:Tetratricopeptide repeat protein n=1 Tax=Sphingomonas sediminicola TaxID=386874 RepID=A0ABX6T933_9SPHN|nr:tetratricopeptide repeat protein [Sphingomonas sediminicola]